MFSLIVLGMAVFESVRICAEIQSDKYKGKKSTSSPGHMKYIHF